MSGKYKGKNVINISDKLSGTDHAGETYMILSLMSYLNSVNIPTKLFLPLSKDERKITVSIKFLQENYLITSNNDYSMSDIEESVQTDFRGLNCKSELEEKMLNRLLPLLLMYAVDDETNVWKDIVDIEHAISVWNHISKYDNLISEAGLLPCHILGILRMKMKFEEGILFGKPALDLLKRAIGKDALITLIFQKQLGIIMSEACKYEDSINILKPLMQSKNPLWKNEGMIEAMIQMADNLEQICRYEEALKIYEKIFLKRSIIEKHESFLDVSEKYALLLYNFGKNMEAIKILNNILKIKQKTLSSDSAEILNLKNLVGNNFLKMNKIKEAMQYFLEVYEKRRVILGEEHVDTLRVKNYMAVVYFKQNKLDAALKIYKHVIEKFKQIFGNKHPETLYTLANYASALQGKGQKEKALEIYKEVHELQVEVLGPYHDETLQIKGNIASLLFEFDKSAESYEAYAEAYEGFKKTYGPKHPSTVELKTNMEAINLLARLGGTNVTTIHDMAKNGDLKSLQNLIANGADVNRKDVKNNTPLHLASESGHVNILKVLLDNGAYYNVKNKDNKTPFQLAKNNAVKKMLNKVDELFSQVKDGNYKKIEQLVKEKVVVNAREDSGSSALHWAANKCFLDIVTLLLENQADPIQKTNKGNTPLHIATSQGFEDIVEILLNHVNNSKVQKNKINEYVNAATLILRTTCLHVAAKKGFLNILKLLLQYGAYYDLKDKESKTAFDLAKDFKNEDVINFLQIVIKSFEYAKEGKMEIINMLKNLEIDEISILKNIRNKQGKTLLQVAKEIKHNKIINKLTEIFK